MVASAARDVPVARLFTLTAPRATRRSRASGDDLGGPFSLEGPWIRRDPAR